MAEKSPQAFRTIREVADWLEVEAHVLRFWESKFTQIKPVKRAGGRRYYRPSDMRLIGGIKTLLHDQGLTIRGAQKLIREEGVAHVAALSPPLEEDLHPGDSVDGTTEKAPSIEASAPQSPAPSSPGPDASAPMDAEDLDSAPPPTVETASAPTAADVTLTEAAPADHPIHPQAPSPAEDHPAEPESGADMAAPEAAAAVAPEDEAPCSDLATLHSLLTRAAPFSLNQRRQLAPMVARLEALAARLGGQGPAS